MPTSQVNLFESEIVLVVLKAGILLILILYAIFSLIVIRQVDLMSKALITNISSTLKFLTTTHAILTIGLIILAWSIL